MDDDVVFCVECRELHDWGLCDATGAQRVDEPSDDDESDEFEPVFQTTEEQWEWEGP